jgi:hypothetical protein
MVSTDYRARIVRARLAAHVPIVKLAQGTLRARDVVQQLNCEQRCSFHVAPKNHGSDHCSSRQSGRPFQP